MSRGWRFNFVVIGSGLLLSMPLTSTASAQVCFRGHPRPRCSGFGVLEFTGAARLNPKTTPNDQTPALFSWSAGYLHNIARQSALGVAFKLAADGDGHRYGPVLRYRRWLGPTWSLDLAPGVFLGGQDNFSALRFPSATADIAINWGDRVGLTVGVDALRHGGGTTSWESYAGLRFGTWWAPLAMVGLGVLVGASGD